MSSNVLFCSTTDQNPEIFKLRVQYHQINHQLLETSCHWHHLDPRQHASRTNRSTEDVTSTALHSVLRFIYRQLNNDTSLFQPFIPLLYSWKDTNPPPFLWPRPPDLNMFHSNRQFNSIITSTACVIVTSVICFAMGLSSACNLCYKCPFGSAPVPVNGKRGGIN